MGTPRLFSLAVGALLGGVLLVGCGGSSGDAGDAGDAKGAEDQNAQDVLGDRAYPCDRLPDSDDALGGFPGDAIPVLDGEVSYTDNGQDNGEWECSVTIELEQGARSGVLAAVELLEGAGFTLVSGPLEGDETNPQASLTHEDYRLSVSGLDNYDEPGSQLTYEVRPPYVEIAYDDPDADEPDAELPEGFPVDEVPLVEGRVVDAVLEEDFRGWPDYRIGVRVEQVGSEAGADAVALLEDAGFEVVEPLESGVGDTTAVLRSDGYLVRLLVIEDKEEESVVAGYDITEIPQSSLALPAGFPDEVPLLDGLVIESVTDDGGLLASVLVFVPVDEAFDQARSQIEQSGSVFDKRYGVYEVSGISLAKFASSTYLVDLSVSADDTTGGTVVSYTVRPL